MGRYEEAFRRSLDDPEGFWREAAQQIDWYQAPAGILDASNPPFYRWFGDGVMNTCFNALDRHVAGGRGDQAALVYDSPVTGDVPVQRVETGVHDPVAEPAVERRVRRVQNAGRATVSTGG